MCVVTLISEGRHIAGITHVKKCIWEKKLHIVIEMFLCFCFISYLSNNSDISPLFMFYVRIEYHVESIIFTYRFLHNSLPEYWNPLYIQILTKLLLYNKIFLPGLCCCVGWGRCGEPSGNRRHHSTGIRFINQKHKNKLSVSKMQGGYKIDGEDS